MDNKDNPARRSIEDLLNEDNNLPSPTSGGLPAFQLNEPIDYDEMKANSINKSKKLMNSLLKFYLSQELIDNNEYIQAKAKLEMMTLSNLVNQMQIAERAITTLMRTLLSKNIFCAKQGKMPLARIIRARTHDQKNDCFFLS